MANTTFTGPVRSEGGFEVITKAATTGAVTTNLDIDASGNITATGDVTIGASGALKLTSITATTASITATATNNTDTDIGDQPAGTVIKDFIVIPQSALTTAGSSGDDLDISIGTASGGGQILATKALLDDGGSAVTAAANVPLYIIENSVGAAAQKFATNGTGPATSEAMTPAATLYSSAARDLFVRFTPLANDLSATGAVKIIVVFQYV